MTKRRNQKEKKFHLDDIHRTILHIKAQKDNTLHKEQCFMLKQEALSQKNAINRTLYFPCQVAITSPSQLLSNPPNLQNIVLHVECFD